MRSRRWLIGLVFLLSTVGAAGDVIHLKDGQSISVRAWHYEGDQLVLEVPGGTVTLPRSAVDRVEVAPPPPLSPNPAAGTGAATRSSRSPGIDPPSPPPLSPTSIGTLSEAQIRDSLDALKRDLREHPQRREIDSREIAALLTALGSLAGGKVDLGGAEGLYREALTYDARFLPALIGLSAVYLREGKDLYARSQIQEGLVSFPKDPVLHELLGEVHYLQEDLRNAIAEWEVSLSLRDDPRVSRRLEKARREFAVDRNYARSEAPHFTLRYEDGGSVEPLIGSSIRDYLEGKFEDLAASLRFIPPAPIVVLLYPAREFHDVTRMPSSVGGLFDGKIRVPIGGLRTLTPAAQAVLLHELTHAFVFGKTGGKCPRWLQEGLAQLMEGKEMVPLEERRLAREFVSSRGGVWHTDFSYPAALSFTRYLTGRFGLEALVEALERMGTGLSDEEALKESTREDFVDLQEAWGKSLAQQAQGGR